MNITPSIIETFLGINKFLAALEIPFARQLQVFHQIKNMLTITLA